MARSSINNTCIDTGFAKLTQVSMCKQKNLTWALVDTLIRCRCLTSTLVALNLVHGVWTSCSDLNTCHVLVINRFRRNQH